MIAAGILAGGTGTRMGADVPKQFLKIGDIPILIRTIRRFLEVPKIDVCILAMNKDWIDYTYQMLIDYEIPMEKVEIIEGGSTRFETLCRLSGHCKKETLLITHDCARPFVPKCVIEECIYRCQKNEAVTVSVPTIDTVLYSTADHLQSESVPIRDRVFLDQGPQAFFTDDFNDLLSITEASKKAEYMEVGKFYLANHKPVGIVQGSKYNFKITTQEDMEYAEFLVEKNFIK